MLFLKHLLEKPYIPTPKISHILFLANMSTPIHEPCTIDNNIKPLLILCYHTKGVTFNLSTKKFPTIDLLEALGT